MLSNMSGAFPQLDKPRFQYPAATRGWWLLLLDKQLTERFHQRGSCHWAVSF